MMVINQIWALRPAAAARAPPLLLVLSSSFPTSPSSDLIASQHACRMHATDADPAAAPRPAQRPSSSTAHAAPAAADDWTARCVDQFSLQPSYLSPLYSTHRLLAEKDLRRKLATQLLTVHHHLSKEVEGYDTPQIMTATQHRVGEMRRMAEELRALSHAGTNLPACTSPRLALGFYALLEEEAAGRDADAEAFHATVHGRGGSVWQHWRKHFAERYARSPGLEPLHVLYSRHEAVAAADSDAPEAGGRRGGSSHSAAAAALADANNPRLHVHMTAEGVARAVGRRKSSVARVSLAPGRGRVLVNGKPYDEALRDPGLRLHVLRPFHATNTVGRFDVVAHVEGGGPSSMAQALQHGIALGLAAQLGSAVALRGMVRRDLRRVERKKPGRAKARKGFAFVLR